MKHRFNQKSFQRGQTWSECLGSWKHERPHMLTRVGQARPLMKLAETLGSAPKNGRIIVCYDQYRQDVLKFLPALGITLSAATNLHTRFFDSQIYFPDLYSIYGRTLPFVGFLAEDGSISQSWGPRPQAVTQALNQLDANTLQRASWLMTYDQEGYNQLAQEELINCIKQWTATPA